jgi:DNA-binding YbaB/EbfC family protein
MTENNPFGGAGGFDMNALLQQAQAMQQQMVAAQEELAEAEVDGTVSDGLVTVTVNGTGELVRVKIRANSFDPADTEDLEDLIVAAYRDARARADSMAAEAFSPLTGGLGALGGAFGGDTDTDPETGSGSGSGGPSPLGF